MRNVQERDTVLLRDLAKKFNLSFQAFGNEVHTGVGPKYGSLILSDPWASALEPAPVTPTDKTSAPFQLLSGTVKAAFDEYRRGDGGTEDIIIAPGIMSGNTGKDDRTLKSFPTSGFIAS